MWKKQAVGALILIPHSLNFWRITKQCFFNICVQCSIQVGLFLWPLEGAIAQRNIHHQQGDVLVVRDSSISDIHFNIFLENSGLWK